MNSYIVDFFTKGMGYGLVFADNEEEAIKKAKNKDIDIISMFNENLDDIISVSLELEDVEVEE